MPSRSLSEMVKLAIALCKDKNVKGDEQISAFIKLKFGMGGSGAFIVVV